MAASSHPHWAVDASDFRRAGAVISASTSSGRMRYQLAARIRAIAVPIVNEQKSRVQSIGSSGTSIEGVSLRDAVCSSLKVQSSFAGYSAGVRIRAATTPQLRRFKNAPRRLNQRSWRHPLFGNRERWYNQTGDPGWFHEPALARRAEFLAACAIELNAVSHSIAVGCSGGTP